MSAIALIFTNKSSFMKDIESSKKKLNEIKNKTLCNCFIISFWKKTRSKKSLPKDLSNLIYDEISPTNIIELNLPIIFVENDDKKL